MNRSSTSLARNLMILLALLLLAIPASARKGKTFINSDDYEEGEEIVGTFLTDEDYSRMNEELEYHNVEFDWGWAKADYGKPGKVRALQFNVQDYQTVRVLPVLNQSMKVAPDIEEQVREVFVQAFQQLGLEVVGEGQSADLELGAAIVDYKSDSTYAFVAMIKPFIELEIRLTDADSGEKLLLIRHQDHNENPAQGAADTASDLIRFLR